MENLHPPVRAYPVSGSARAAQNREVGYIRLIDILLFMDAPGSALCHKSVVFTRLSARFMPECSLKSYKLTDIEDFNKSRMFDNSSDFTR